MGAAIPVFPSYWDLLTVEETNCGDICLRSKVLVTKLADKTKICLATDFKEPLILHWALSKNGNEWLVSTGLLMGYAVILLKVELIVFAFRKSLTIL